MLWNTLECHPAIVKYELYGMFGKFYAKILVRHAMIYVVNDTHNATVYVYFTYCDCTWSELILCVTARNMNGIWTVNDKTCYGNL